MKREYTRTPDGRFARKVANCPFCGSKITLVRICGTTYFGCDRGTECFNSKLIVECPHIVRILQSNSGIRECNRMVTIPNADQMRVLTKEYRNSAVEQQKKNICDLMGEAVKSYKCYIYTDYFLYPENEALLKKLGYGLRCTAKGMQILWTMEETL